MTYEIRDLEQSADMVALEELQVGAWGFSEREVLPSSMFKISAHSGGVVAAAYPVGEPDPVGFVYGFPAVRNGALVHHSHQLAVLPEHRGGGLAVRLKLHQRSRVLGQDLKLMTWTMDPLLARNARLNLGKLGARAVAYHPDWYAVRGGIYAGLPADRFMLEWDLAAEPRERGVQPPVGERALAARDGDPLLGPLAPRLNSAAESVLVELPRDLDAVKAASLETALAWRLATRETLSHYLGRGYAATDLMGSEGRVFYRLEPR